MNVRRITARRIKRRMANTDIIKRSGKYGKQRS